MRRLAASCTAAVAKAESANIADTRKSTKCGSTSSTKPGWTLGRTLLAQTGTGQQLTRRVRLHQLARSRQLQRRVRLVHREGLARTDGPFQLYLGARTGHRQRSPGQQLDHVFRIRSTSITFGTYGTQPFDVKYTYSLLMLYQEPWFRTQKGFLGHVLGGWTIAPLFTARSGLPLRITDATNGEAFGEVYSGQTANYEEGIPFAPFTGGSSPQYNVAKVTGSANPLGVATSGSTGMNLFPNPIAAFNEFRPPVLGIDTGSGGAGILRGAPFWNLDATVSKDFRATERIGATLMIQFVNLLNHFVPADPTTSLATASTFGVINNQYTQPNGAQSRWMEFGLRLRF